MSTAEQWLLWEDAANPVSINHRTLAPNVARDISRIFADIGNSAEALARFGRVIQAFADAQTAALRAENQQSGEEEDYEYPPDIKAIYDKCVAGYAYFTNDNVSALLVEIDRLAAYATHREQTAEATVRELREALLAEKGDSSN